MRADAEVQTRAGCGGCAGPALSMIYLATPYSHDDLSGIAVTLRLRAIHGHPAVLPVDFLLLLDQDSWQTLPTAIDFSSAMRR